MEGKIILKVVAVIALVGFVGTAIYYGAKYLKAKNVPVTDNKPVDISVNSHIGAGMTTELDPATGKPYIKNTTGKPVGKDESNAVKK